MRILENWDYSVRYGGCWENLSKYRPKLDTFQAKVLEAMESVQSLAGQPWRCGHQQGSLLREGAGSP